MSLKALCYAKEARWQEYMLYDSIYVEASKICNDSIDHWLPGALVGRNWDKAKGILEVMVMF